MTISTVQHMQIERAVLPSVTQFVWLMASGQRQNVCEVYKNKSYPDGFKLMPRIGPLTIEESGVVMAAMRMAIDWIAEQKMAALGITGQDVHETDFPRRPEER